MGYLQTLSNDFLEKTLFFKSNVLTNKKNMLGVKFSYVWMNVGSHFYSGDTYKLNTLKWFSRKTMFFKSKLLTKKKNMVGVKFSYVWINVGSHFYSGDTYKLNTLKWFSRKRYVSQTTYSKIDDDSKTFVQQWKVLTIKKGWI